MLHLADVGDLGFLPSLPVLTSLTLSHNKLRALPPLGGMECLSFVDVSHNDLANVDDLCGALHGAAGLRTLEASANTGLAKVGRPDSRPPCNPVHPACSLVRSSLVHPSLVHPSLVHIQSGASQSGAFQSAPPHTTR